MAPVFVSRAQWGAARGSASEFLDQPVSFVISSFTYTEPCYEPIVCTILCRRLQRRDGYLRDIRYNFVVCGDGRVYEGRGWFGIPKLDIKLEAKEKESIYIGCMGFADGEGQDSLFQALMELIEYGVENKYIEREYEQIFD